MDRNQDKRYQRSKEGKALRPKSFPNYLIKAQPDNPTERPEETDHTTFVADEYREKTAPVPFLTQKKEVFDQHLNHEEEPRVAKDYFVREKKRFREEARNVTEPNTPSFYQSRRPFQMTEIPSYWKANGKHEDLQMDYKKLKAALVVPTEDLILLDENPPQKLRKTVTNKALHRSLSGIMEQEKMQKPWDKVTVPVKKDSTTGFRSYFDQ